MKTWFITGPCRVAIRLPLAPANSPTLPTVRNASGTAFCHWRLTYPSPNMCGRRLRKRKGGSAGWTAIEEYKPIPAKEKFKIGAEDSLRSFVENPSIC